MIIYKDWELVYIKGATIEECQDKVNDLLKQANKNYNVFGSLVYTNGMYVQPIKMSLPINVEPDKRI